MLRIAENTPNQGYHALRKIQGDYHPSLTLLDKGYYIIPEQQAGEALEDFIGRYQFYLRMLAYLKNYSTDLNDEHEQTQFIHRLQGSVQILSYIRSDRHVRPWEQRYSAGQFFQTIHQVIRVLSRTSRHAGSSHRSLQSSRHAARSSRTMGGSSRSSIGPTTSASSRLKQLNAVHSEPFDLFNLHSLLDYTPLPFDGSEDHALYNLEIGLNQLQANLDKYKSFPCAVCNNPGHSFQNCPLLQDTPKVREAYGKLRAYLNRCCNAATKLNKSLSDLPSVPVQVLQ